MKRLISIGVFGFLMAGSVASALPRECTFPDATYKGKGEWKNFDDQAGSYNVTTVIKDNQISTEYVYAENQTFKLKMTITEEDQKCKLTVSVVDDKSKGQGIGYCSSEGCSYRVKGDEMRLEENFMFKGRDLYRVGFKVWPSLGDKGIISWKERLPTLDLDRP